MSETRFHGVRSRENTDLQQAINDIDSSVIGIVAVADDADPETFPLNTPVLLTRVSNVLGKAGKNRVTLQSSQSHFRSVQPACCDCPGGRGFR